MNHTRDYRSPLSSLEKRLLLAMAARLPAWLSSDHLSFLGLSAMLGAGFAFARIGTTWWTAAPVAIALAANWFGDSLDGTLARVRRQERPRYGFYVDHVIDLAGTAAVLAGMAASGRMSPSVALAVAAAFFLVSAEAYLATHAVAVFRMAFLGIGPTELRILLAAGAFYVAEHPWIHVAGVDARFLDAGGVAAVAGLLVAFIASAVRNTRALYLAEPLPPRTASRATPGHAIVAAAGLPTHLRPAADMQKASL